MFLSKLYRLKGMLSFRLTLWHTFLFTTLSLLCLSVFYFKVSSITLEKTDEELLEEIGEFQDVSLSHGLEAVLAEIREEVESEDEELVFFQIRTDAGETVSTASSPDWRFLEIPKKIISTLAEKHEPVFTTLSPVGAPAKIRLISGHIGPETVMHIGFSLEENEEYLEIFRHLILSIMSPLFLLAALLGWFMSKKALRRVEEVTHAAVEIAAGDYDRRVQVKDSSEEINLLATTFNNMVDRLQEVVQAMREMTDNIAHDLRSPLARIRGIAEMTLTGRQAIAGYREMAINTIEESDNLIELINTMLEITETETGVGRFASEEIDIKRLIHDACEVFQPLAQEKNISLSAHLPDTCSFVGDRSKMQRLIANLLENAIKYTERDGKVRIKVKSENNTVEIAVEDNGVGISEDDFPHIFNRFYRCDQSRSLPGTGLGLSLAKAIAEAFGGNLSVSSTLQRGSIFTVSLPRFR